MKTFWLKLARYCLNKLDQKDLLKNTDLDNKLCRQLIKAIDNQLKIKE